MIVAVTTKVARRIAAGNGAIPIVFTMGLSLERECRRQVRLAVEERTCGGPEQAHNQAGCRLKKCGGSADGGNLYLQVSKWGTKAWLFRFMLNGRSRDMPGAVSRRVVGGGQTASPRGRSKRHGKGSSK